MDSLTEIYTLDFHNPHPSIELYLFEHLSKYKGIVTTNSKLEQQDNGQQWITMDNNGQQSAVLHASLMPFLTTYSSPHPLIQSQSDPSTLALHPSEVVFSNNFSQITSTYCSLHQSRLSHRGGDTRPWNISDNTQEPLSKNFPEEFCKFMC